MFIPNNAHQYYDSVPTETANLKKEGLSVNHSPYNCLYAGSLFAIPVSISLWAIIIWGIKLLFFNSP